MPLMTKSEKKLGRPPGRKPAVTVFARIDPRLGSALERYVDSVVPKTTATAVVELAISQYLERVGFWPPPPPAP